MKFLRPTSRETAIGWRKHVIQISWERGPDGRKLFAGEKVTVDTRLVHAWGVDNATDYLHKLLEA